MTRAIINGTLIDGRGGDPQTDMTIMIEQGRISAVGRTREVRVPKDAEIIDAGGGSILPGLIDCHVHFAMEYPDLLRSLVTSPTLRLLETIPRMRATLDAGITTVRDAGGTPAGLKLAVERGIVAGPRCGWRSRLSRRRADMATGTIPAASILGCLPYALQTCPTLSRTAWKRCAS